MSDGVRSHPEAPVGCAVFGATARTLAQHAGRSLGVAVVMGKPRTALTHVSGIRG